MHEQLRSRPDMRMDLLNACLWRGAQRLILRPKTFSVLECLVRRPKQLVTKDCLLNSVWPDVVVTETVLGVCICELRRALEDTAKAPQWIETVHRRGYRYIGDLEIVGEDVSPQRIQSTSFGWPSSTQRQENVCGILRVQCAADPS